MVSGMLPYGNSTRLVNDPLYTPGLPYDEKQGDQKNNLRAVMLLYRKRFLMMWLIATRDIEAGEELFWSYGSKYWDFVSASANREKQFDDLQNELSSLHRISTRTSGYCPTNRITV